MPRQHQAPRSNEELPWLAETRPGRIRQMKLGTGGLWWVGYGDGEEGRVAWRFERREDRDAFHERYRSEVIRVGNVSKLKRDYKVRSEKEK